MCTKNEAPTFNSSKVTALNGQTDRQTNGRMLTDNQSQLKLLSIRIRGW